MRPRRSTICAMRCRSRRSTNAAQARLADAQQRVAECEQFLAQRLRARACSTGAPPASRIGSTTRRSPAACGRSPTASRGFRAWCATSPARSASRCSSRSSASDTQVDRDILAKLEAPLGHLLRNAVDHGIESPDERVAAGKPAEGVVRLEAATAPACCRSSCPTTAAASISRGCGEAVVQRGLADRETAAALSEAELLEFLFLPGFSMKDDGDRDLRPRRRPRRRAGHGQAGPRRGARHVAARQGHALPAAAAGHLSVVRALLVEIAGEPYAFPLARIVRAREAAEGEDRGARGPPAFRLRRPAGRAGHGAPGAGAAAIRARRRRAAGRRGRRPAHSATAWWSTASSASASWSSSRSTRGSARSRTSAPARCWTTARRC